MSKFKVAVIVISIIVIGVVGLWVLLAMKAEPPKRDVSVRAKVVSAETVRLGDIAAEITAYGRVTTVQPLKIISEVSGTLMQGNLPFQPSQSFKNGDLLAKIDDRQAVLRLNSTKSDLLTALATVLPEIKLDFPEEYQVWQDYFNDCSFDSRLEELPETDNPKIKLFLSRFNVYKLYFSVRDLEITLDKHYIYAPFDGSIVSTGLRVGSTVGMGSLLGEIINLEDMEVEVPVAVSDVQWFDENSSVRFTSSEIPGEWMGRITRIGSDIDTRTQTVKVFLSVDQRGLVALLNGVFLEAHIAGTIIKQAVRIPSKALYQEKYVYLISDGQLEYREVTVARQQSDAVIISGGLRESDTLVTDALMGVAPGMPATPRVPSDMERGI